MNVVFKELGDLPICHAVRIAQCIIHVKFTCLYFTERVANAPKISGDLTLEANIEGNFGAVEVILVASCY